MTESRVPAGVPTGGQFVTSSRGESAVALAVDPQESAHGSRGVDADGFSRDWPRMVAEERRYGTVRTTNGGEVSGYLTSNGNTYAIDVQVEDGRYIPIMAWRVAGVRLDPASIENSDDDSDRCPGLHESRRVAWTQAQLVAALRGDNHLAPAEAQSMHRQIAAEAHWLLTLPDDEPVPSPDEAVSTAQVRIRSLPLHQAVPDRLGPLTAERADQIADYFTARAATAIRDDVTGRLDFGPTATNACVNSALLLVARLRNPEASSFAHDAHRSILREQMRADLRSA